MLCWIFCIPLYRVIIILNKYAGILLKHQAWTYKLASCESVCAVSRMDQLFKRIERSDEHFEKIPYRVLETHCKMLAKQLKSAAQMFCLSSDMVASAQSLSCKCLLLY